MNGDMQMCGDKGHSLVIEDDSFSHEFGVHCVVYYRCSKCGATDEDDPRIPTEVGPESMYDE